MTTASAPGKLVLAGEYAVAFGAAALVTAVDRRAVARFDAAARAQAGALPLLDALVELLPAAAAVVVDSTAFHTGGRKLGLGSSAAVVTAAAALALDDAEPSALFAIARAAHALAQGRRGAPGSGIDLAAAAWGGTLRYQAGVATPIALPPGRWLAYDLGAPADTATLLAHVTAARAAAPGTIDPRLQAIADAATALALATTTAATIAALAAAAAALAALADATGLDLATPRGRAVQALAASVGGAAKTCGAGGGDVGVAVVPDDADVAGFRTALAALGVTPLELRLGQPGTSVVHRAP